MRPALVNKVVASSATVVCRFRPPRCQRLGDTVVPHLTRDQRVDAVLDAADEEAAVLARL